MKIGIDARLAYLPGIGRYIEEIIVNLAKIDNQNQYYIYYYNPRPLPSNYYRDSNLKSTVMAHNFRFIYLPIPPFSLREQLYFPVILRRDSVDLFHSPYFNVPLLKFCPYVLTMHDTITTKPRFSSLGGNLYYEIMKYFILRIADKIIVVSNFQRQDFAYYMPKYHHKVHMIYHGVNDKFCPEMEHSKLASICERYGLQKDYLLYVGTLLPYKNLPRLIKAYSMVKQVLNFPCQLVIAARKDPRYIESIHLSNRLGIEKYVRFLGWVSDKDLPALYGGARMLILASLYETFGFPIVEAMACGIPVITSNIMAMKEVAGDAALLVDPFCPEEIKDAILKLHSDTSLRSTLIKRGFKRASRFSWKTSAEQLLAVYEYLGRKKYLRQNEKQNDQ